jgi:lipopolysaccharide/colanic/teichoic acid biosynthesis glycosyltransferase
MWRPETIDTTKPLPDAASRLRNRPGQRVLDLAVALPLLLLSTLPILLGALAVVATSRGGAFYLARRSGRDGVPFTMYKLRTMAVGRDDISQRITAQGDARVTLVGRVLRALKVDELPQLLNVVRGDMSMIGPRPEDHDVVSRYYDEEMRTSLRVRPGVTSAASIYWYPDLFFHDPPPDGYDHQQWYLKRHMIAELRMDTHYELQRTVTSDLLLILRTATTIVRANLFGARRRPFPNTVLPGTIPPVSLDNVTQRNETQPLETTP